MRRIISVNFDCEKFIAQIQRFIAQSGNLSLILRVLSLNLKIYRSNASRTQVNLMKLKGYKCSHLKSIGG